MKTLSIMTIFLMLSLCGCVTNSEGKKVPDVRLMQSVAQTAAYTGTALWLKAHSNDRGKFELARSSLAALIAAGSFDAVQLTQVLQTLPVKELQSEQGTMIIGAAVSLWDAYGRQLGELDKAKVFDTYILPVAKSILTGLDAGLAAK